MLPNDQPFVKLYLNCLKELSMPQKEVYCLLSRRAEKYGYAFCSYDSMANDLNIHRATIIRAVAELKDLDYIKVEQVIRGGRPNNHYYILKDLNGEYYPDSKDSHQNQQEQSTVVSRNEQLDRLHAANRPVAGCYPDQSHDATLRENTKRENSNENQRENGKEETPPTPACGGAGVTSTGPEATDSPQTLQPTQPRWRDSLPQSCSANDPVGYDPDRRIWKIWIPTYDIPRIDSHMIGVGDHDQDILHHLPDSILRILHPFLDSYSGTLILCGEPGIGKTCLASALVGRSKEMNQRNWEILNSRSILDLLSPKIIRPDDANYPGRIYSADYEGRTVSDYLLECVYSDSDSCVWMDDVITLRMDFKQKELLGRIIHQRMDHADAGVLISTNVWPSQFKSKLKWADLMDRFTSRGTVVEVHGPNKRQILSDNDQQDEVSSDDLHKLFKQEIPVEKVEEPVKREYSGSGDNSSWLGELLGGGPNRMLKKPGIDFPTVGKCAAKFDLQMHLGDNGV